MKAEIKFLMVISVILAACALICGCLTVVSILVGYLAGTSRPAPAAATPTASPTARLINPTFTVTASATATENSTPSSPDRAGSVGIGDPYFPTMGNGGYDVQHYDLELTIDMKVEEISAVATIEARATQPLSRFNLDFKEFHIRSITVNGMDAAFEQTESELTIMPAAELNQESDFTVEIAYDGRPGGGQEYGGLDYLDGWNFYPGGVIVAGEPAGAETWFPSNNHPSDKATYAFRITVAKPYIVAANGVLRGKTDRGDGTWTYEWAMDDPMASYLATIAVGNFDILEGTTGSGVPYRNYLDADIRSNVEEYSKVLPDAVDFFASTFGPYPFDAAGVVVHRIDLPFSLENQTLIVMGHTFAYPIVVVHELAHQWYGDSISVARWKDIWLNEGFASYAETLWLEHIEGFSALKEDLVWRYETVAGMPSSRMNLIGDPGRDHLFDIEVYDRGALTLHALRLKVGDDTFFRLLREYCARYRDSNAAIEDFIALAEEVSGQDLGDFFQAWLYEKTVPDIPELDLYSSDYSS
jgi:aminopeptidase N